MTDQNTESTFTKVLKGIGFGIAGIAVFLFAITVCAVVFFGDTEQQDEQPTQQVMKQPTPTQNTAPPDKVDATDSKSTQSTLDYVDVPQSTEPESTKALPPVHAGPTLTCQDLEAEYHYIINVTGSHDTALIRVADLMTRFGNVTDWYFAGDAKRELQECGVID